MADSHPTERADDTDGSAGTRSAATPPARPRWVVLLAVAVALLLLGLLIAALVSGGEHGPMRHANDAAGRPLQVSGGAQASQ
jgi:hypothetical protein